MKNSIKGLSLILSLVFSACTAKEKPVVKEEFKEPIKLKVAEGMEIATFAGGCFWCTEAVFLQIDGVKSVLPGYIGGTTINPTYFLLRKRIRAISNARKWLLRSYY